MELNIDADSIAYRAAAAAEKRIWLVFAEGDEFLASFPYKKEAVEWAEMAGIDSPKFKLVKEPEPVQNALHNVREIVKGIVDKTHPTNYNLILSGETNYRDEVATIKPYKGNRENLERPYHLQACRKFMVDNYWAEVVEGYEADDEVSMRQMGEDTCIVTIDKDLDTVPGWHYNWVEGKKYFIEEDEAWYNFYYQMLVGDSVDNIAGCPGIGKAIAPKILEGLTPEEMKCAVGLWYAIKYDNPEAAFEENARLLWMSRNTPNDWSWER